MSNTPPNKPTTSFPHVDPRVTSPAALRYAAGARDRHSPAPALPKYDTPTAGGPTPAIPLLDTPHVEGQTMEAQAAATRRPPTQGSIFGPAQGAPSPQVQAGMFGPQAQQGLPPPPPPITATGPLRILPQDMLPPEAVQDPAFQHGQGSQYASSQPELARKYGVIRGSQRIAPQMLEAPRAAGQGGPPQRMLKPETVQGLKAFEQLQQQASQSAMEQGDKEAEAASRDSAAGQAAKIGSGVSEKVQTPMLDELDLDTIHNRMVQNLLQNEEQREIVETRLKPMDLSEIIMQGWVTQIVPIQPGIFEPEFKSVSGEEDLAIKRLIIEEANSLKVDDRYLLDKFALMGLTLSLHKINGKPLISHTDEKGKFNSDMFWAKFNQVTRFPLPMLASLGTHYFYFDVRVRKLFVAERVKNG